MIILLVFGVLCGLIASIVGAGSSMMMTPLLLYLFPLITGHTIYYSNNNISNTCTYPFFNSSGFYTISSCKAHTVSLRSHTSGQWFYRVIYLRQLHLAKYKSFVCIDSIWFHCCFVIYFQFNTNQGKRG